MKGETVFTEGSTATGKITFPEGNHIIFGQDFAFYRGVPHGIEFTVRRITDDGTMELTAPGYGDKGAYGNGAIHVRMGAIPQEEYRRGIIAEAVRRLSNTELAAQVSQLTERV